MNIESKLNCSLRDIVVYLSKTDFKIDYDKYGFVLTDEEIYVLNKLVKGCLEKEEFSYDKISEELYLDAGLAKKKADSTIVARLLIVAYNKMLHVDNYYRSDDQFTNTNFSKAMGMNNTDESITLADYKKFDKDGVLHATTSRLERFIIKYDLGMMHMYKRLSLPGDLDLSFYDDLATFCHQLGYTEKRISRYKIDGIISSINSYLIKVKDYVDANKDVNNMDLAIAAIDEALKQINKDFRHQNDMPDFNEKMDMIHEKLAYITELSKPYIKEENENERRLEN